MTGDIVARAIVEACAQIVDGIAKQCGDDLRRLKKAGDDLSAETLAHGGQIECLRAAKAIRAKASDIIAALPHAGEVGRLKAALEFYADRSGDGYDIDVRDYGLSTYTGNIISDGGKKAREALGDV